MGRNGGTAPGKVALKISPTVLQRIKYPPIYIIVTGTNGKTSTTGMIRKTFEKAGYKVASNRYGDNLLRGAASTILASASLAGRVRDDVIVLESDELTLGKNIQNYKATDIVLNNFFRDQLDRCGEMATVIGTVAEGLSEFKGRLFVNGDDPNLANFEGVRYGVNKNHYSKEIVKQKKASEARFCPTCGARLVYNYYQYSHIGDYYCAECGFKRMPLDFAVDILPNDDYVICNQEFKGSGQGLYQYYNEAAAATVCLTYGIEPAVIKSVLDTYETGIGRMEQVGEVLVNLVKNPTGLNQVIDAIVVRNLANDKKSDTEFTQKNSKRGKKERSDKLQNIPTTKTFDTLLFVLNNNTVDGVDVSWIWDADVELLVDCGIKNIICSGLRAYDMAIRFEYQDVGFHITVIEDLKVAAEAVKKVGGYAVSTYSGLLEMRGYLQS